MTYQLLPWNSSGNTRGKSGGNVPLGLKGGAILPESRVLAVADIVEAMGADRPYWRAHGLVPALAEIERMAGNKLGEEIVRVCVVLFRKGRLVMLGLR